MAKLLQPADESVDAAAQSSITMDFLKETDFKVCPIKVRDKGA